MRFDAIPLIVYVLLLDLLTMRFIQIYFLLGMSAWNLVSGLGGTEEKFIKKYAMMKVYESCFGPQVLKEIRKEMREAAQKCSDSQIHPDGKPSIFRYKVKILYWRALNLYIPLFHPLDRYSIKDSTNKKPTSTGDWYNHDLVHKVKPTTGNKVKKPIHTTDTLLLQQWSEEQKQDNSGWHSMTRQITFLPRQFNANLNETGTMCGKISKVPKNKN